MILIKKWCVLCNVGYQFDVLFVYVDVDVLYVECSEWLIEFVYWLCCNGMVQDVQVECDVDMCVYLVYVWLCYLFYVFDCNFVWKVYVVCILCGILCECDGILLLCDVGMFVYLGFFGVLFEWIDLLLILFVLNCCELLVLFMLMFLMFEDVKWIDVLFDDLFVCLVELILFDVIEEECYEFGLFLCDLLVVLYNLICQISLMGLLQMVCSWLFDDDVCKLFELQLFYCFMCVMFVVEIVYVVVEDGGDLSKLLYEVNYLCVLFDECWIVVDDVFVYLYCNGVLVDIVFQVEWMCMCILCVEMLLNVWMVCDDLYGMVYLIVEFVDVNQNSQSVVYFVCSNFLLFVCKFVEINVDIGEYYILCGCVEYLKMLWMVVGGGFVIVVIVCVKFVIMGVYLQLMFEGLFVGINYVVSFMLMYFLYFMFVIKQFVMIVLMFVCEFDDIGYEEGVKVFVVLVIVLICM